MALWAHVDPEVDLDRWSELGVGFLSGRRYAFDGGPEHAMRIGFSPHDERELAEAARRMAVQAASRAPEPHRPSPRAQSNPDPGLHFSRMISFIWLFLSEADHLLAPGIEQINFSV